MPQKRKNRLTYRKGQTGRWYKSKKKTGVKSINGPSQNFLWNKNGTLLLLKLCQENRDERDPPLTEYQFNFYKKIACAMENNGYHLNPSQCYNRIDELFKHYKKIKDHKQTEQTHEEWEYYEAMEASCSTLFRDFKSQKNPEIDDSPKSETKEDAEGEIKENTEFSSDGNVSTRDTACSTLKENKPQNNKIHSQTSDILKWLETLKKDDDENEVLKRRHAENAELLQALIKKIQ